VRYTASAQHLFGVIEIDEAAFGGPRGAGFEAYQRLVRFQGHGEHGHIWRIWNFLDAINEGEGDAERYRQFCLGRAEGIGAAGAGYPAASALGRRDGSRLLQVIWIAGRTPPERIENPRQVSAFRYPRQYGPASPSFSRAARIGDRVLISGTASIVGHESRHGGDVRAQTAESLENLAAVVEAAGLNRARLAGIKSYVRHAADVPAVAAELDRRGFAASARCLLLADICRRDLLVEFEAIGDA
jgi:chorismate lyase/3-hydroxybenzoate synthase